MRKISKFLKSNKSVRFLIIFSFFCVIIILFSLPFSPSSSMDVHADCIKKRTTEEYCQFICDFRVKEYNATARIMVVHSGWIAIFDEELRMESGRTEQIEIKIPYRGYAYSLYGGFYNENKYGTLKMMLEC